MNVRYAKRSEDADGSKSRGFGFVPAISER